MPKPHSRSRIENLRPRLASGVQQFVLPEGDTGLYRPADGAYLRVESKQAYVIPKMDGEHTLSFLAVMGLSRQPTVSIHSLVSTLRELAGFGWLSNSPEELHRHGLTDASITGRKIRRPWFAWHVTSRALGTFCGRLFSPSTRFPLSDTKIAVSAVLALLLAGLGLWLSMANPNLFQDPLFLNGRYSLGLLAVALGSILALLVRELFRGALLVSENVGIFAAGFVVRLFLISPYFDPRHIFRAGNKGAMRLFCASLAGTFFSFGALLFAAVLTGHQALFLGSIGAGIVFYFSCCPFVLSDFGRLVDTKIHRGEARNHVKNYLRLKLFRRIATTKPFKGESNLLLLASFSIGWVYAGFYFGASTVESLLLGLKRIPIHSLDPFEKVTLLCVFLAVSLMAATWLMATVIGTIVSLFSHRPKSAVNAKDVRGSDSRAKEIIEAFPVFSHLDEAVLTEIAKSARVETYRDGSDVVRQGRLGNTFYIIGNGEASVLNAEDSGAERYLAALRSGDGFGEMALLDSGTRTATVRAKGDLEVAAIGKDEFLRTLEAANIPPKRVTALLRATHTLHSSEIFSEMTPSALGHIVGSCSRKEYAPGEKIIGEGEPGDSFFIIESGNVDVMRQGENTPIAHLGPGDYFGELALLLGSPRTATVMATKPCALLSLDKEGFMSVLARDFDVAIRMESIMDERASASMLRPS